MTLLRPCMSAMPCSCSYRVPCWAEAGRAQLGAAEERAHRAESRGRRDSARAAVFVVAMQRLRALIAEHEVQGLTLCGLRSYRLHAHMACRG